MSDPNKFINTYIDTAMATLHEYLGSSLQLKTQLKMANDLLIERDTTIAQLSSEVENLRNNYSVNQETNEQAKSELLSCQDRLKIAEESHSAIKSKLSHMDTLLNQVTEMKREIQLRDETISNKDIQIANLHEKIKLLENPPPAKEPEVIPTAVKTQSQSSSNTVTTSTAKLNTKVKITKTKEIDDDF